MELVIFVILFFALRYFVISKRPELKGEIIGVLLIPIIFLAACYFTYEMSDNLSKNVLRKIDSLRYLSTYTSFMDGDIANLVSVAQEYGCAPYEFVSRSPEMSNSFMLAVCSAPLAGIGIIISLIWLVLLVWSLMDNNPRKTCIKIFSIISYSLFVIASILTLFAFYEFFEYLNTENNNLLVGLLALPVLYILIHFFNRSYGDLYKFIEKEQKTE